MNSKTCLCIGVYRMAHIWLRVAKSMGYRVVATHSTDLDQDPFFDRSRDFIDHFAVIDFADRDEILNLCDQQEINFILPHSSCNASLLQSMFVAESRGLYGPHESAGKKVTNKTLLNPFLQQNQLPSFEFQWTESEALRLAQAEHFPIVAKPNLSAGSIGVRELSNRVELETFLEKKDPAQNYLLLNTDEQYVFQPSVRDLPYLGVDAFVQDGELIPFHLWDGIWRQENSPFCYGPRLITSKYKLADIDFSPVQKMLDCLGIKNSCLMLEGFHEDGEIRVIFDVNLRPTGMKSPAGYNRAFDFNLIEEQISLYESGKVTQEILKSSSSKVICN